MNGDVIARSFDWPRVEWLEHETLTSEKGIWTSREGSRRGEPLLLGRKRRRTRNKYMGGVMGGRNPIAEPTAMSVRCRVAKYYDVRQLESRRRSSSIAITMHSFLPRD